MNSAVIFLNQMYEIFKCYFHYNIEAIYSAYTLIIRFIEILSHKPNPKFPPHAMKKLAKVLIVVYITSLNPDLVPINYAQCSTIIIHTASHNLPEKYVNVKNGSFWAFACKDHIFWPHFQRYVALFYTAKTYKGQKVMMLSNRFQTRCSLIGKSCCKLFDIL